MELLYTIILVLVYYHWLSPTIMALYCLQQQQQQALYVAIFVIRFEMYLYKYKKISLYIPTNRVDYFFKF